MSYRYSIIDYRSCKNCGTPAKPDVCWACQCEGCEDCIVEVLGPDGEFWKVCERCEEGIRLLTDAVADEKLAGAIAPWPECDRL